MKLNVPKMLRLVQQALQFHAVQREDASSPRAGKLAALSATSMAWVMSSVLVAQGDGS